VLSHLTDSERIFAYRALRFARGDSTSLPGYDENVYAKTAETDNLKVRDLVEEFESGRRAAISMFRHLPEAAWARQGVANNNTASVRALAFVIVGHARHHLGIIRKRLNLNPVGARR
jgi:hypothetical protein